MAQEESGEVVKKKTGTNNEKAKPRGKQEAPPTKVVIRRLPPTMTEEMFLEQVSPIPSHNYLNFVEGDTGMGLQAFSRAYINFVNQEDIFMFQEKFDGYVFVDQKGNEFTAIVEFAPYQKIPKPRESVKQDDRCNTIENDPDYLEFLKKLDNPEEITLPSIETYLEQLEIKERERKANRGFVKVVTPLVEFIENKRHEREKMREERRDERRKRDLERKKAREAERMKKKEKRDKEKTDKDTGKRHEEKKPVKLLKNIDRDGEDETQAKIEENKEDVEKKEASKQLGRDEEKPRDRGKRDEDKRAKDRPKDRQNQKPKPVKVNREVHLKEPKVDKVKKTEEVETKPNPGEGVQGPVPADKKEREETEKPNDEKVTKESKEQRPDRKVRNKDRPAIEIYRPGSRRSAAPKSEDPASDSANTVKADVKSRTFTRSTQRK